ncbi:alpha-ketoglutarate-dependent dioxygenase AlkB [Sandaracinus amylolyticus]|uniref:Alkylated DNA repair protein n=1 Tax=Sandaracinus amylolyticus TaxID=927083 RepID=A0A0F6YKV0_9BACT|nr:alpha-ketoglutarate-dependent dioxygenase AlkB [Sandaracinus amylolyticus]AKF08588.1 Alkylated DNA repair protein [Sandaracinus amylolyticus]
MQLDPALFTRHALDETHALHEGELPPALRPDAATFERLWALHPDAFHEIKMHGRLVKTPRWQQAYGADYRYTGNVNRALPVPPELEALHEWARTMIDPRLNGLLLNWYDAAHEHYIGKHRDSTINMVEGTPIVTVSFGSERAFRLRPWRAQGLRDFAVRDGTVLVMPWETNLAYTHEVPHAARSEGRRISVTLRAFRSERTA